jgi:hypothetical protein
VVGWSGEHEAGGGAGTGVLRALAALLMAVAGDAPRPVPREESRPRGGERPRARSAPASVDDREWQERAMEELRGPVRHEREPSYDAGASPLDAAGGAADGAAGDVEQLLADARARAHAEIDESIERAQELMRGASPEARAIERVERALGRLAGDVRSLHGRLDALEALLRGRDSTASTPPMPSAPPPLLPPTPVAPLAEAPPAAPLGAEQPRPAPVLDAPPSEPPAADVPPPTAPPRPPSPIAAAPPVATPPPAPVEPPTSAAPVGAPANGAAALSAPPLHLDAPSPPPAPVPDIGEGADPGGAFFSPGAPLTVRVAPVSGFQGLMRVQDALARVRGVGEAGVEAYSQGEARLRLELVEPLAPASLAAALAERLAQPTSVEEASATERSVRLALR